MRLQKVYIELVFLDNFIVNLLVVFFSSRITKAKITWGRYVCSAAVGGIYACVVFGTSGFAVSVAVKIAVSLGMCFVAFYRKYTKGFFKNVCAFYITSFVFAGAIYASMFCFGEPAVFGASIVVKPLLRYILIGIGLGALLISIIGRVRKRTQERERLSVEILLEYGERRVCAKAYMDSGNMAKEPLSGLGVVFVTKPVAEMLFDQDTIGLMLCETDIPTDRLRIIRCTTAAGESVFFGIQIDRVSLKGEKAGIKAVVCIAKSTLAGGCDAIVGNMIIDKLKGARNEEVFCAKDTGMDTGSAGRRHKRRLYQRQRGTSAAVDPAGRSDVTSSVR